MKKLVLGDIHGLTCWKDIISKENPDQVIFLGDYVSTHLLVTQQQQIDNFHEILDYKESNSNKVILLRGNHLTQHLGYYWASCSGYFRKVAETLSRERDRILNDTQWIYKENNIIFSHAGVSQIWLDSSGIVSIDDINDKEPSEIFGFCPGPDNPFDMYGDSIYQSCEWIRPDSLYKSAVENTIQVVGHTNYGKVVKKYNEERNVTIYLCDALPDEYLIIEDGNFIIKKNE